MTNNPKAFKRSCRPNRQTSYLSQNCVIKGLGMLFIVSAITACSQNNTAPTTADRVKLVEEVQKKDPNFHLPRPPKAPREDKSRPAAAQLPSDVEKTANATGADGTEGVTLR